MEKLWGLFKIRRDSCSLIRRDTIVSRVYLYFDCLKGSSLCSIHIDANLRQMFKSSLAGTGALVTL